MSTKRNPDIQTDGNQDERRNGGVDEAAGESRIAATDGGGSPGERATKEATKRAEAEGEQAAHRVLNSEKDDD